MCIRDRVCGVLHKTVELIIWLASCRCSIQRGRMINQNSNKELEYYCRLIVNNIPFIVIESSLYVNIYHDTFNDRCIIKYLCPCSGCSPWFVSVHCLCRKNPVIEDRKWLLVTIRRHIIVAECQAVGASSTRRRVIDLYSLNLRFHNHGVVFWIPNYYCLIRYMCVCFV